MEESNQYFDLYNFPLEMQEQVLFELPFSDLVNYCKSS